jgi:lipopolysaccharide export system ATP-binding protein
MALLECVRLVKEYGEKLALDNVDFHVEQGELVALVGREGAGKTTAYGLVCGLLSPTSGRVRLNGIDVTDWMPGQRERLGIRFVPQDASVYQKITAEDALLAAPQSLEMNVKQRRSQVDELLFQFGLDWRRNEIVGSLSFGEQMRLAIAKCLVGNPSLLLLDEPFEATDVVTTHGIESILSELPTKGISVLLTDNRGLQVLPLAHRTYVLRDGKVIASGNAVAVLGILNARRAYFGDKGFPKLF